MPALPVGTVATRASTAAGGRVGGVDLAATRVRGLYGRAQGRETMTMLPGDAPRPRHLRRDAPWVRPCRQGAWLGGHVRRRWHPHRPLSGRGAGGGGGRAWLGLGGAVGGCAEREQREMRRRIWMEKRIEIKGFFAYIHDHRRGMDPDDTT